MPYDTSNDVTLRRGNSFRTHTKKESVIIRLVVCRNPRRSNTDIRSDRYRECSNQKEGYTMNTEKKNCPGCHNEMVIDFSMGAEKMKLICKECNHRMEIEPRSPTPLNANAFIVANCPRYNRQMPCEYCHYFDASAPAEGLQACRIYMLQALGKIYG